MPPIRMTTAALKSLDKLQPKQLAQIAKKIFGLCRDASPHDSKKLHGTDLYRVDSGEFRVIYRVDAGVVVIEDIGKRNDGEVYRGL